MRPNKISSSLKVPKPQRQYAKTKHNYTRMRDSHAKRELSVLTLRIII